MIIMRLQQFASSLAAAKAVRTYPLVVSLSADKILEIRRLIQIIINLDQGIGYCNVWSILDHTLTFYTYLFVSFCLTL